MTSELSTFGFLCELNDETVKACCQYIQFETLVNNFQIYTIERGIIELKNTGDLKLGAWYDIWENVSFCYGSIERTFFGAIRD